MLLNQKISIEFTNEQAHEFLKIFKLCRDFINKELKPEPTQIKSKYSTIDQFCEQHNVSHSAVYNYKKLGMPCLKRGNKLYFDEKSDAWMESRFKIISKEEVSKKPICNQKLT